MTISQHIPFSAYQAGAFSDLVNTSLAQDMWYFLSTSENINRMKEATAKGKSAIEGVMGELQNLFGLKISRSEDIERIKIMCLNMSKQIMEMQGYEHIACVKLAEESLFTTAGLFKKNK